MSLSDKTPKLKFPRSAKFKLSEKGVEVELSYREAVVASRTEGGRAAFDAARVAWAGANNLQPDDGLYLAEVREGPVKMQALVEALESCGKTKPDAIAAVERLVHAGLIAAEVQQVEAPAPLRRW